MTSEITLTAIDRKRYAECCKRIAVGITTCFDVGLALTEIRDDKLYREEFDTFEEFCKKTFRIERAHAYRLIESAEIKMSPIGDKIENEAQARAIAKVPEEDRKAVLKIAEKTGVVTAAAIAKAAEEVEDKPALRSIPNPTPRKDAMGRVIPPEVVPDWDKAVEVATRLRSCASEIKVTVERGLADKDIIFAEITNPTVAEASGLHYTLSQIAPHAVCPVCQGRTRKNCQLCKRRGWISKFLFNSPAVSADTRALLAKAGAK